MYRNTEHNPWQLLFSTLLNTPANAVTVIETENELQLNLPEELIARLTAILKTPEAIRAGINYRLSHGAEIAPIIAEVIEDAAIPAFPDLADAPQILKNLFGTLLEECGLHEGVWRVTDAGYLSLPIPQTHLAMRKAGVKLLQRTLAHASLQQLRNAFLAGNETLAVDGTNHGIFAEHTNKIICLRPEANEIAFDCQLLFRHVFPPQLRPNPAEAGAADNVTIYINKQHLMAYLSGVFEEGFVLHQTDGTTALPICLASARTIQQPLLFRIVLDCSSSLQESWEAYIDNIQQFVTTLSQQAPHAQIQFYPFADRCTPSDIFKIENLDIIQYLTSLKSGGQTLLYGSVHQALTEIPHQDCVVIVFTDGLDNKTSQENKLAVTRKITRLSELSNPPQIFTFGFGSELSEELMNTLATATGASYTKLTDQAAFDQVFTHTAAMCTSRELVHFIQNLTEEVRRFTVSAYEGQLSVGHELVFGAPFAVAGRQFQAEAQEPQVVLALPPAAEDHSADADNAAQAPVGWGSWFYNNAAALATNTYDTASAGLEWTARRFGMW